MKAKPTIRTGQHLAKVSAVAESGSSQVSQERIKTMKKMTTAQLIPMIALGCTLLFYSATGCSRAPEAPPKSVSISCDDRMKYDLNAFEVTPGQKVVVTISNKGTTPKASMG